MENLSDKIGAIERKVRQLALKLERLQKENTSLLEENDKLKGQLRAERNKAGQLELKLAEAPKKGAAIADERREDPGRTKQLRKEIDQHIKQIDKCIEWLQNS